jgi:NADH:ubiquinone oxidoreductase subunit K
MSGAALAVFWPYSIFVILIMIIGIYCMMATFNLIRVLIALELLIKAVTLLLIIVGYVSDHAALAQSLVITLIVIEVVVMVAAAGVVLGIHNVTGKLNTKNIREMKG